MSLQNLLSRNSLYVYCGDLNIKEYVLTYTQFTWDNIIYNNPNPDDEPWTITFSKFNKYVHATFKGPWNAAVPNNPGHITINIDNVPAQFLPAGPSLETPVNRGYTVQFLNLIDGAGANIFGGLRYRVGINNKFFVLENPDDVNGNFPGNGNVGIPNWATVVYASS